MRALALCPLLILVGGDWKLGTSGQHSSMSIPFSSSSAGYTCPTIACLSTFPSQFPVNVHFTVGTNHMSSFLLTLMRVCDLFQHCIDSKRIQITLHIAPTATAVDSNKGMRRFLQFFQGIDLPYQIWNGSFTSTNKVSVNRITLVIIPIISILPLFTDDEFHDNL